MDVLMGILFLVVGLGSVFLLTAYINKGLGGIISVFLVPMCLYLSIIFLFFPQSSEAQKVRNTINSVFNSNEEETKQLNSFSSVNDQKPQKANNIFKSSQLLKN